MKGRLVLTLKEGQTIFLGENLEVVYLRKYRGRQIKVLVVAPTDTKISRDKETHAKKLSKLA